MEESDTKAEIELEAHGLNAKQEMFCKYYVSEEFFAHGVNAYCKAYGLNPAVKKDYDNAKVMASKLLTKTNICNRINELLDLAGFNENFVDKELLFLITQKVDFPSKATAIKEFNKLRQRITDKLDLTTKGKSLNSYNLEDLLDERRKLGIEPTEAGHDQRPD